MSFFNKNKIPSVAFCRKQLRKVYPGAEFEFEGEAVNVTYVVPESGGLLVAPVLTLKLRPKEAGGEPASAQQLAYAALVGAFRGLGFETTYKPSFLGGSLELKRIEKYVGIEEGLEKQIAAEESNNSPVVEKGI